MERADLEAVAEVLRDTDIFVISDEIYAELTFGDAAHVSIAEIDTAMTQQISNAAKIANILFFIIFTFLMKNQRRGIPGISLGSVIAGRSIHSLLNVSTSIPASLTTSSSGFRYFFINFSLLPIFDIREN